MECITAILDAAASLEDQCGGLIQKLLSYHITRIRLFHKLVKRKLYDLAKTLALQDVGQVREITAAFEQLHSGMIASYDQMVKNLEEYKKLDAVNVRSRDALY